MRYFHANGYKIEEVELLSQTAQYVTVRKNDWMGKPYERREKRLTEWGAYYPTREECKQWIVDKRQREVNQAKLRLEGAEKQLEEAKKL